MPVIRYVLMFLVGAACFYLLNGIIISTVGTIRIKEGYRRLFSGGVKFRYFLTAVTGGIAALASALWQETLPAAVTLFALLALMLLVTVVDIDTMEIPNGFVAAIFVVALVSCLTMPETSLIARVIGFFCVSVPLLLLTLLIPGAFGGGDIKLMAACGFFLGWKLNLIALAIGIFTGGIWGIWLLATKKKERKEHFAFGPFLCVGVVCAWFLGERLLDWYWGFLVL